MAHALPFSRPDRSAERRRYPRARSGFAVARPAGLRVVDISPYGARLFAAFAGATLFDEVEVQAQGRAVSGRARCRVVNRAPWRSGWHLRVHFDEVDAALQEEILRTANAQLLVDGIAQAGARAGEAGSSGHRVVTDRRETARLLEALVGAGARATFGRLHRGRPVRGTLQGWGGTIDELTVDVRAELDAEAVAGPLWWCAAAAHESYLVRSESAHTDDRRLWLAGPHRIVLTERREAGRTPAPGLVADVAGRTLSVHDVSDGGVGLLDAADLVLGTPVAATLRGAGWPTRRVALLPKHRSERVLGAALVDPRLLAEPRRPVVERRWAPDELLADVETVSEARPAERVSFGPADRRLAGLWHEVEGQGPRTAIVLPPAWARTKESVALLAQTLCATFAAHGRAVGVLRFDYAETLGESHRSPVGLEAGREALGLTVSGCVRDIHAALDEAVTRLGGVERLVLVGMSFSGPLCLRAATEDPRVTDLVQLMGASDIQDLIRAASGGIDYVARYLAGERPGLQNVLGLLSDVDRWAPDGLDAGLLRLGDAQRDAGQLSASLLWICGDHDAFVNVDRVRSVVDAAAAPDRTLAHVPCGHVPTRTREAVAAWAPLLEHVLGHAAAVVPEPDVFEAVHAAEWKAAPRTQLASAADYWRGYMVGESDAELGYDVLTMTREYGELMALQARLLDLRPGAVVHDLGGGHGHAVPYLVEAAGEALDVHLYDLVPEVLTAAQQRWSTRVQSLHTTAWDASAGLPTALHGADRVLMSLFLTVLPDPLALLRSLRANLAPGAVVVASSIRPDADLSLVYQRLMTDVTTGRIDPPDGMRAPALAEAIRRYMSSAAHLLRLAEEGTFRLFDRGELADLLATAGFEVEGVEDTFGQPPRAVVVRAVCPTEPLTEGANA